jgi:hypothetical protein
MTLTIQTFAYARDQDPAELNGEARGAVIATLTEWLRIWLPASFIDGEYIADGGILIGESRHAEMDLVAWELLCSEPTLPMHNVVGAFLDGYWGPRAVSESFDLPAYCGTLDRLPLSDRAYAATALALYSALCSRASRLTIPQQSMLRERLLTARGKILSHNVLPYVLGSLDYLVKPGQSRPIVDIASYRGYRCDDGPKSYFVVERLTDHTDVVHVHALELRKRTLEVLYEIVDSKHLDVDVPPLISACILKGILEDRFRGQADNVEYVNTKTKTTTTLPYDDVGD